MFSSCAQVLELEGEKGEWGFKALKQMIKINFKLVSTASHAIVCLHISNLASILEECFFVCLNPVDKLSRDDEQVQTAPYIHQKCCHQELFREVHQLHPGLHLYLQTGMDGKYETEKNPTGS